MYSVDTRLTAADDWNAALSVRGPVWPLALVLVLELLRAVAGSRHKNCSLMFRDVLVVIKL